MEFVAQWVLIWLLMAATSALACALIFLDTRGTGRALDSQLISIPAISLMAAGLCQLIGGLWYWRASLNWEVRITRTPKQLGAPEVEVTHGGTTLQSPRALRCLHHSRVPPPGIDGDPTPFHQTEIFLLARLGSPDRGLSLWTPPTQLADQAKDDGAWLLEFLKSELGIPIVDS